METKYLDINRNNKQINVRYVEISAEHADRRIDNYLYSELAPIPRSRIYQMIRRGEVRVDGKRIKPGYRLQPGDKIRIPPVLYQKKSLCETPKQNLLEMVQNCIIYDDKNLLALNKPSGLVVHAGSGKTFGVIELLRTVRQHQNEKLQLVHRLDRDTSGILLVAKNMLYLRFLHECLKEKKIKKNYKAILKGRLEEDITVNKPLSRNLMRSGERLSRVSEMGKNAETIIMKDNIINDVSFVDIEIKTGRTHQIRVHTASINHPVAGDDKYGDRIFNRQMKKAGLNRLFLHASSIEIPAFKAKNNIRINAPLPDDLRLFLSQYKRHEV